MKQYVGFGHYHVNRQSTCEQNLAIFKCLKWLKFVSICVLGMSLCACGGEFTSLGKIGGSSVDQGGNDPKDPKDPNDPTDPTDPNPFHTEGQGGSAGSSQGQCDSGRRYRLQAPSDYEPQTAYPIVVSFHGLGDTLNNFHQTMMRTDWYNLGNQRKFLVMVPESMNTDRQSFLHFTPNGNFDRAATQDEMTDVLNCVYYDVGGEFNIDTEEIYWIGFSEGASFSSISAIVFSKELKAVVPYAGIATPNGSMTRDIPSFFITGTNDGSYQTIKDIAQDWINLGHAINETYPGGVGHSFLDLNNRVPAGEVWDWITTAKANPVQSSFKKP
jgi:poly(3-hydroxybutyrate) depolymerase